MTTKFNMIPHCVILKTLLVFFSFTISSFAFSQFSEAELQKKITETQNDKTRNIEWLLQLSESYRISRKIKSSIETAQKAVQSAGVANDKMLLAKSLAFLGRTYCSADSLAHAKNVIDQSFAVAMQSNNIAKAYSYWAKATFENYLDNTTSVIENTQQALLFLGDEENHWLRSRIFYLQYQAYTNADNSEKREAAAKKSLEHAQKTNDLNMVVSALQALSNVYEDRFRAAKNKTDLTLAIQYLEQAYQLCSRQPEIASKYSLAIVCNNLANIFLNNFPLTADNEIKINRYLNQAESLALLTENQTVIGSVYGIKSQLAKQKNNWEEAEKNLLKGYETIKKMSSPNLYSLFNFTTDLADFYEQKNQLPQALTFQKERMALQKEMSKKEQAENIRRIEIINEVKQKETEIEYLKKSASSRKVLIYMALAAAVFAFAGLFLMWRAKKFQKQFAKNRELVLQKEREETEIKRMNAELQIKIEQQENARILAEKQLAETEKNNLQKALYAGALQVERKNKILQHINKNLQEGKTQNIKRVIKREQVSDRTFAGLQREIKEIHPDFYKTLQESTTEKLTKLDLKICSYLMLKMDTHEMAEMLNITPKSVTMSKYRVKQKLSLHKEQRIEDFLESLV